MLGGKKMTYGIIFYIASLIMSGALYFLSLPVSEKTGSIALIIASFGAGALIIAYVIGSIIARKAKARESEQPRSNYSLFSLRVGLVLLLVFVSELCVTKLLISIIDAPVVMEITYYLILFVAGVVLARWCSAAAYVAPTIATIVLAIPAASTFISFVTSSEAHFRFGPERWILAMQQLSGQVLMLPLDVSVSFAAWYVFSRKTNLASN
jgi:hypothetical protein